MKNKMLGGLLAVALWGVAWADAPNLGLPAKVVTGTVATNLVCTSPGQCLSIINQSGGDLAVAYNQPGLASFTNAVATGTATLVPAGQSYSINLLQPLTIYNVWLASSSSTNVVALAAY